MSHEQSTFETRAPAAGKSTTNHPDACPMPSEESELRTPAIASNGESGAADYSWRTDALVVPKKVDLRDFFVTQSWHRPYAEALLESDPEKLPALIADAERAILSRYIELSAFPEPTDEVLDLQHAVFALSQLSKPNSPGETG